MVNDKDIHHILALLPKEGIYYFTQASVARALPVNELQQLAYDTGLTGKAFSTVAEAYDYAVSESESDDFLFIGGSNFIVADLLNHLNRV